jgi:hypothetical protein
MNALVNMYLFIGICHSQYIVKQILNTSTRILQVYGASTHNTFGPPHKNFPSYAHGCSIRIDSLLIVDPISDLFTVLTIRSDHEHFIPISIDSLSIVDHL